MHDITNDKLVIKIDDWIMEVKIEIDPFHYQIHSHIFEIYLLCSTTAYFAFIFVRR